MAGISRNIRCQLDNEWLLDISEDPQDSSCVVSKTYYFSSAADEEDRDLEPQTNSLRSVISEEATFEMNQLNEPFVCIVKARSQHQVSCSENTCTHPSSLLAMAAGHGHLECVKHLVEERDAGVDELGTGFINGKYEHQVLPIWCAVEGGYLEVVTFLLSKGAYSQGKALLRSACFHGHLDIAKLLVEQGGDIETADARGVTCLMLASHYGRIEVVKYLISIGAEVNKKRLDGKSALHCSIEQGHLEVVKVLLDNNADVDADCYGSSPLLTASGSGHKHIVEHILSRGDLTPRKEQIDALELLGATLVDKMGDVAGAVTYWKKAMDLRHDNDVLLYPKAENQMSCCSGEEFREFMTLQQLDRLEGDRDALQMQSFLVSERIHGPAHFDTMQRMRNKGVDYAYNHDFKRCISLWLHGLDVHQKHLEPLDSNRLFFITALAALYTHMINREYPHFVNCVPARYFDEFACLFERITRETEIVSPLLRRGHRSRASSRITEEHASHLDYVISLAIQLIYMLIKLKPDLSAGQWLTAKTVLHKLVKVNPRGAKDATLLHLACSRRFPIQATSLEAAMLPSLEVVNLLLETGADPRATDGEGNTPLHALARNTECPKDIMEALLSAGAHLDAVNNLNMTFEELRSYRGEPLHSLVNPLQHTNLQCLAAASVRRHGVTYRNILHPRLSRFVDMH
ncbi:protein fem-1 homolog C-like [Macrobrachium nipponense]|uniref:protein fem-1 homolog C-like n=1 Tax=Macrobrachium nipponense TaxID=159736 RepID=UPI0030C84228